LVFVLVPLLRPATACEPVPLAVRTVQPAQGATDVPIDVRIAVSFVGYGTAGEFEVGLYRDDVAVAAAASSSCYEHEGPYEVHCWWFLRPAEPLATDTAYTIRATPTAAWSGEGPAGIATQFTTGSAEAPAVEGVPTLRVTEAWDEVAPDTCAYPVARRYWLELHPAGGRPDPSALSLFHLDALDADGSVRARVHTAFVTNPGGGEPDPAFKQYLDASTAPSDCFRVVQEGPDGNLTAAVDACYAPPGDTASPDTATHDTASPDTAPSDTGALDSGPRDTPGGNDTGDGSSLTPRGDGCGGCVATGRGGIGAALLVALALGLGVRRR
jgi:hypothetical protein